MKLSAPIFGMDTLRIDISSLWMVPLTNMKWHSLSLLTDFSLRSTLSGIGVATPDCLLGPFAWKIFFHPLTLSQCLFVCFQWDVSLISNICLGVVF
jgi:hypothetical protein